jgi:hypothetical protein
MALVPNFILYAVMVQIKAFILVAQDCVSFIDFKGKSWVANPHTEARMVVVLLFRFP